MFTRKSMHGRSWILPLLALTWVGGATVSISPASADDPFRTALYARIFGNTDKEAVSAIRSLESMGTRSQLYLAHLVLAGYSSQTYPGTMPQPVQEAARAALGAWALETGMSSIDQMLLAWISNPTWAPGDASFPVLQDPLVQGAYVLSAIERLIEEKTTTLAARRELAQLLVKAPHLKTLIISRTRVRPLNSGGRNFLLAPARGEQIYNRLLLVAQLRAATDATEISRIEAAGLGTESALTYLSRLLMAAVPYDLGSYAVAPLPEAVRALQDWESAAGRQFRDLLVKLIEIGILSGKHFHQGPYQAIQWFVQKNSAQPSNRLTATLDLLINDPRVLKLYRANAIEHRVGNDGQNYWLPTPSRGEAMLKRDVIRVLKALGWSRPELLRNLGAAAPHLPIGGIMDTNRWSNVLTWTPETGYRIRGALALLAGADTQDGLIGYGVSELTPEEIEIIEQSPRHMILKCQALLDSAAQP